MKAVLGVDGSDHSEWGPEWLVRIPFRTTPRVLAVHGVDADSQHVSFPSHAGNETDKGKERHSLDTRAKLVVDATKHCLRHCGLEGSVRVETGPIPQALVKHAGKSGLIVLGSRGLGAVGRFMMGSVSTSVILHAPCSVLVMKEPPKPVKRILFATDGSSSSAKARQFLIKQFQPRSHNEEEAISILLVHAMPYFSYARVKEAGEKLVAQEVARLEKVGYRVRELSQVGSPAEEIMKVASREQPDLIVTGAKGRGMVARFLQGSVSTKLVQRSDCSVLVIR